MRAMFLTPGLFGLCRAAALVLAAAGWAAATAVAAAQPIADWHFRVFLDDREIGYHDFSLYDEDGARRVRTAARFDVRLLFITAFRYRHENVEVWRDGCLASIAAETNQNGDRLIVNGRKNDDGFRVATAGGEQKLPACIKSFAYWNPQILDADRLLNSQTGEYEDVEVAFDGEDTLYVDDRRVPARRYRLKTKSGDITLWYAKSDRRWLALEAPAKGNRRLRYEAVRLPAPGVVEQLVAAAAVPSRS